MNALDSLKLSFYNSIRKTPDNVLFAGNMWLTYGVLYQQMNNMKKYFNDTRMSTLAKRRKMLFRIACMP